MRLLDLPDAAIELIDAGELSKGHGKALLTEPDHFRRRLLARRAVRHGWSVRALEAEIARGAEPRPRASDPHPDQVAAAARLHDLLAQATDARSRRGRIAWAISSSSTRTRLISSRGSCNRVCQSARCAT
jgi:ParB family chromosome partitioning protein